MSECNAKCSCTSASLFWASVTQASQAGHPVANVFWCETFTRQQFKAAAGTAMAEWLSSVHKSDSEKYTGAAKSIEDLEGDQPIMFVLKSAHQWMT